MWQTRLGGVASLLVWPAYWWITLWHASQHDGILVLLLNPILRHCGRTITDLAITIEELHGDLSKGASTFHSFPYLLGQLYQFVILESLSRMTSSATQNRATPRLATTTRISTLFVLYTIIHFDRALRSVPNSQMRSSQATIRDHELIKYLQLLPVTGSDGQSYGTDAASFSFRLPVRSTLRDALVTYVELLRLRLGMCLRVSG